MGLCGKDAKDFAPKVPRAGRTYQRALSSAPKMSAVPTISSPNFLGPLDVGWILKRLGFRLLTLFRRDVFGLNLRTPGSRLRVPGGSASAKRAKPRFWLHSPAFMVAARAATQEKPL